MRSLLLCSRPPWPLSGGDRIRTWHLARWLSSLGPVDLLATRRLDEDADEIREGLPFVRRLELPTLSRSGLASRGVAALLSARPLQQSIYACPTVTQRVAELVRDESYDVLVAHLLRTLPWLPSESPPLLVDIQDALSAQYRASRGKRRGWRGLAMALEEGRIGRAEREAVARADGLSFISPSDATQVDTGSKPVAIVGAALDFDKLHSKGVEPVPGRIGFLGNLRTAPNRDMVTYFARAIFPKIKSHHPAAEFHVFGHEAGRDILKLGTLSGVRVVGSVEDQAVALESCWVTVCPLRFGSGVQNKILESLAVGTPVVASPDARAALPPNSPVLGAALVDEFAATVGVLLSDSQRRSSLSIQGKDWVRNHCSPEAAFAPLGELLESLV